MTSVNPATVARRIESERLRKFLGTANVRFQSLDFPVSESGRRKDHLELRFQQQGHRGSKDLRHRINATVSLADLEAALDITGISRSDLLDNSQRTRNLEFPPDVRLTCLHGRAAVKAAEEVFDDEDGRWLVNLYLPGSKPSHVTLYLLICLFLLLHCPTSFV